MSYIPLKSVESSMIKAIGYDRKKQTLRVMFQDGAAYDYPTFSDRDWKALNEAESVGKHFNKFIKPLFGHSRVTERQLEEPCCDHPGRDTCDESCGPCDEQCCPPSFREKVAGLSELQLLEEAQRMLCLPDVSVIPRDRDLVEVLNALHERLEQNLVPDEDVCKHPNKDTMEDAAIVVCVDCAVLISAIAPAAHDAIDQDTCEHTNLDATMDDQHTVCTDCWLEEEELSYGTED